MAAEIVGALADSVLPGLGMVFSLLDTIHQKYEALKEGKELCVKLTNRLNDFAKELRQIPPETIQADVLLAKLVDLVQEFLNTVTVFADRNFVKRMLKLDKFNVAIEIYNERLDHLIRLITIKQSDKLARLLNWREQFEQDLADTMSQLTEVVDAKNREIWLALKNMEKRMATKREIEDLVMVVKRDVSSESDPDRTPQPLDPLLNNIIKIAEKDFLGGKQVQTPPGWLIAGDEVETIGEAIDDEGLTSIFVGDWQGARVAVKKFGMVEDESPVFDKHFRVWRSLMHPHVAQLYGAGSSNGAPFFVYEYASRQSLDRCWDHLGENKIWRMLYQAALGLIYLHKKHIVHGNLSSAKLLVTEQGDVKLFGFGASYFRENNKSNTLKTDTREEFAAPECIGIGPNGAYRGDRHSARFESDVYSFGLTILEAIAKRDPFLGKSLMQIRKLKQTSALVQPDEMSDDVWTLVSQMCVCDPNQRVSLGYVAEQLKRLADATQSNQHP